MTSLKKKKNILLVYPGRQPAMPPQIPMGVIVLASYLRKNGYNPSVLDTRVENFTDYDFSKYGYIGLSTMSGSQLSDSINLAKIIKKKNRKAILIWGGVHPTFYPEQTVKSSLVDYVVRGEGELTIVELLNKLNSDLPLDYIKGITYLENGIVKSNPNREFLNMETLNISAYDLLKLDKYGIKHEYFSYESSRGCPFSCTFCYVNGFHNNRWRAKSATKVLDEIQTIIETHGAKRIRFIEDLWVVNKVRTQTILKGFIERNFNINWLGFHHARLLNKYTEEDYKLIKKSGCNYLNIGGESGSDYLLDRMKKKTTSQMLYNVAKKCLEHEIVPSMSFIIGSPGERPEDLTYTLKFYSKLMSLSQIMEINAIFVYSPYPGSPLYEEAIKLGYKPKIRFEDWVDWTYTNPDNTPWLSKKQKNVYEVIFTISRFLCLVRRMDKFTAKHRLQRLGFTYEKSSSSHRFLQVGSIVNWFLYTFFVPIFKLSAKLRWKIKYFNYAFEWKLWLIVFERKYQMR